MTSKLTAVPRDGTVLTGPTLGIFPEAENLVQPNSQNKVAVTFAFHCYRQSMVAATIGSRSLQAVFQSLFDLRVTDSAFGHTLVRMLRYFHSCPKIGRVKPIVQLRTLPELLAQYKRLGRNCC